MGTQVICVEFTHGSVDYDLTPIIKKVPYYKKRLQKRFELKNWMHVKPFSDRRYPNPLVGFAPPVAHFAYYFGPTFSEIQDLLLFIVIGTCLILY